MNEVDERLREAWQTGEPKQLHRVAEQLAHEGHPEATITDALERLLLEVRAAGADDATEDLITDVMERLVGWCHESNQIRTQQPELPAIEEKILTRRA